MWCNPFGSRTGNYFAYLEDAITPLVVYLYSNYHRQKIIGKEGIAQGVEGIVV